MTLSKEEPAESSVHESNSPKKNFRGRPKTPHKIMQCGQGLSNVLHVKSYVTGTQPIAISMMNSYSCLVMTLDGLWHFFDWAACTCPSSAHENVRARKKCSKAVPKQLR